MVKKVECLECKEVYELSKDYPISMIGGIYCIKCNADYPSLVALNNGNKWKEFRIHKNYSNHYFNIELKAENSSGTIYIESQEDPSESISIDMKTGKLLVECFKEMKWINNESFELGFKRGYKEALIKINQLDYFDKIREFIDFHISFGKDFEELMKNYLEEEQ